MYSQNTMVSFEHVDFLPKILLFRPTNYKAILLKLKRSKRGKFFMID
jgi:hypothetical protein